MINERAKYTSNTGMAIISAANPNRDGSGTVVSIITGVDSGTLVERVIIKARGNTTRGMVRLFCYMDASNIILLTEVQVPAVTQSATDNSFCASVDLNFKLDSGFQLMASTEKAETFTVTAEGLDWTY